MGSTEIINQTARALDIQVGNWRYFINLTTVGKGQSYTVHLANNDGYKEFSLGGDAAGKARLIVSSDDCVDNKKIIIREVDGEFQAEMEPRVIMPTSPTLPGAVSAKFFEAPTKRSFGFWRLWIF